MKRGSQGQETASECLQSEADHPDHNGLPAVDKRNGEQWPDWRWPMYTRNTHHEQSKVQRSRGSIKHHLKVLSHSPLRTFSLPLLSLSLSSTTSKPGCFARATYSTLSLSTFFSRWLVVQTISNRP